MDAFNQLLLERRKKIDDEYQTELSKLVETDKQFYEKQTSYYHFDNPQLVFSKMIAHKNTILDEKEKITTKYHNDLNAILYEVSIGAINHKFDQAINELIALHLEEKNTSISSVKTLNR
jgi:uncharacterized protein YifN (PemK superfamily)